MSETPESTSCSLHPTGITKAPSKLSLRQEVRPPEAPPALKPPVTATIGSCQSNGQIHSQYHGYYVKAEVKVPPPEDPIGMEDDFHPSSLARLPPPNKQVLAQGLKVAPASDNSPVPPKEVVDAAKAARAKRQESSKPKSLSETKKASMELAPEVVKEESVSVCECVCETEL